MARLDSAEIDDFLRRVEEAEKGIAAILKGDEATAAKATNEVVIPEAQAEDKATRLKWRAELAEKESKEERESWRTRARLKNML
jgi:hypothetical protein